MRSDSGEHRTFHIQKNLMSCFETNGLHVLSSYHVATRHDEVMIRKLCHFISILCSESCSWSETYSGYVIHVIVICKDRVSVNHLHVSSTEEHQSMRRIFVSSCTRKSFTYVRYICHSSGLLGKSHVRKKGVFCSINVQTYSHVVLRS